MVGHHVHNHLSYEQTRDNYSSVENSHSFPSPVYDQNCHFTNHRLPPNLRNEPPPLAQQHQQHTTWMDNPGGYLAQPVTIPPQSASLKSTSGPAPRTMLNDYEKRSMCQMHEDNPGLKQADLGSLFGVERSTVSKVLRDKEKFLSLEEPIASPPKHAKGERVPDIERALKSWWIKDRDGGILRTAAEIKEKATKFATILRSQEGLQRANDEQWLDNFEKSLNAETKKVKRRARKKTSRCESKTHLSRRLPGSPHDVAPLLSGPEDEVAYTLFQHHIPTRRGPCPPIPSQGLQSPFFFRGTTPPYAPPTPPIFPTFTVDPAIATTATSPALPSTLDESSERTPPTQDSARLALEIFLKYINQAPPVFVDNNEYLTILRLIERMRQHSFGSNGRATA
ncbi:hypothetical protein V496_01699 [Pseudogymnoascus sp. VKM F-4515 (FW-2607)]|nr:hypothetical protein V496_01699 [Pseudogymnoascus sp. VKM F-4515 (FW-2607)]